VSGDDAAAPPAAIPPQIEPSVDPAHAEPVRAFDSLTAMAPLPIAPASEPVIQRLQRPVGAEAEPARAHDVETPARTAAEAAASPPLEAMANVPAAASPVLPPEPGAASSAEPMTAAVGAVLEPSSAWNPADETSRVPAAPEPVPALRGTMLAPSLAPLEAQRARPVGEPAPLRPSLAAVPRRAEPPADPVAAGPVAAGTARLAPSRAPSASRPTSVVKVAPQEIAAPPPAASGEPPPGRLDPADRFTRTYRGGECFFPVPVASQDGGAIAGYGLQAESVQAFRQAYAQRLGVEPDVDWRPITDSQCGGISFARIILGGSPPGVHIGLDRKEIGSGEDLAGRVTGSRFEFVTLLLVDDAGLVHNVLDYLRPAASGVEFSFPVHPVDDGMDRVQLIMAVSASMPLAALNRTTAVHSDDFFPELLKQAREAGALLDLGLEDFVILDRPS
jgi:hypothetical protein